jgi:hypothetical protein
VGGKAVGPGDYSLARNAEYGEASHAGRERDAMTG